MNITLVSTITAQIVSIRMRLKGGVYIIQSFFSVITSKSIITFEYSYIKYTLLFQKYTYYIFKYYVEKEIFMIALGRPVVGLHQRDKSLHYEILFNFKGENHYLFNHPLILPSRASLSQTIEWQLARGAGRAVRLESGLAAPCLL
jgi:hypothetical protein